MQNRTFLVLVVAILAVGLAVIIGARTMSHAGRPDTVEGQQAIETASQGRVTNPAMMPNAYQQQQPNSLAGRLPGNKGQRR